MAKRRTIWVQQVAVDVTSLEISLAMARARELSPEQEAAAGGVQAFIDRARAAAGREDPVPWRVVNWWRGVLVEAAYRNLHAARAHLVDLYSPAEIDAEIPGAVARAHSTLHRDDPRCITPQQLRDLPGDRRRAWLRRLLQDGYEAVDLRHAQLRSFRNILLIAAACIIVLLTLTTVLVAQSPDALPLCFPVPLDDAAGGTGTDLVNCPTRAGTPGPTGGDIGIVVLVGLLGGALAASVAIRGIKGTSTPYDVPVALAWLKVPLGAFTAVLGLVAIQGGFVPGLTALDSQEQILAYALVLGFAQQAFTGVLDRRAQSLLDHVPSKDGLTVHEPTQPGAGPSEQPVLADRGSRHRGRRKRSPATIVLPASAGLPSQSPSALGDGGRPNAPLTSGTAG